MKKYILCALLVFTGFSAVFSQSNIASFFITPVTGMGTSPEDNTFFFRQILFETEFQRYVIARSQQTANYILQGTLIPGDSYPNDRSTRDYIFNLSLINNNTNEVIADQELIYQSLYDVLPFIPIIISNLLSSIPIIQAAQEMQDAQETQAAQVAQDAQDTQGSQETQTAQVVQAAQDTQNVQETQPPDRCYNRLYAGAEILWMPKNYNGLDYFNNYNFGFGLSAEWQFLRFLSFGAGGVLNLDWIYAEIEKSKTRPFIYLEIPVTLRFIIKPSEKIMIAPFGGVHFNFPIYIPTKIPISVKKFTEETSKYSWIAGLQFGINAGPGILTFTPSFSMDIPPSKRMLIYVGIGYKFGFLKR